MAAEEALLALAVGGVIANGEAGPRLWLRGVGTAYSGEGSPGSVVATGGAVTLGFAVADWRDADYMQLVVPALPGTYRFGDLSIRGNRVEGLGRRVIAALDRRLDDSGSHEVRYAADAGRPVLEIDLRDLGLAPGSAEVRLSIAREDVGIELRELLHRQAAAASAEARLRWQGLEDVASTHGEVLRAQAALIGAAHRAAMQELQHLVEASGELARRVERVAAIESRQSGAQRTLDDVVQRLVALAVAADDERARNGRMLADLQAEVARVHTAMQNVFWRRWLRRLRGVHA